MINYSFSGERRAGIILTLLSIFSGKVIFKDMMLI